MFMFAIPAVSLLSTVVSSIFAKNLAESLVDNVLRDTVKPVVGSVVYCDLIFGTCEHSGIYVGNDKIVHLDGSGRIEVVSSQQFLNRLNGLSSGMSIYVSSSNGKAVGSRIAANRALEMVGRQRDYGFLTDNCHQFTSGCLTGDFEAAENFLWFLKTTARQKIGADEWRVWN